ncbi:MAG: hypothetical protein EZS28_037549, partial [Streblomastix strix]
ISDAAKKISIHAVFYEKRILQQDMIEIVKKICYQNAKRYYYNISEGKDSILIAGQLCKENDEPFNQIVQCIQDDSIDDVISNWSNVIHKVPSLKEKEKQETNTKRLVDVANGAAEVAGDGKIVTKTHVKNYKIADIDFDDNLIVFNKEQIIGLLNKFETTFENLEKITAPIRYSPHIEEFIKECYTEWYNQRTHNHNVNETTSKVMKYFKQEFTNKWFYSIIKHLDPIDQQNAITQASGIIERKRVDAEETEIWSNFTCTCNDVNGIPAEKGEREYFQNLCKDIHPQKQDEYNEEFMSVLLHYFRTLDIQGFDAEDFIVQASRRTNVVYNEQLERQYTGLNQVDRYVVDNFAIFEIGVPIED